MLAIVCTWAWFCYMCIRIERDAKKKNKEIDLQHDAALAERRRAIAREIEMRDLRRLLLPIVSHLCNHLCRPISVGSTVWGQYNKSCAHPKPSHHVTSSHINQGFV